MVEVAIFAELSDDVHVVGGLVDVVQFHNVLMAHHFHDVDLRLDVLEVVGVQK